MTSFSSVYLLGALGVLTLAPVMAAAAPDTSQWTCSTCPFEDAGVSGTVDAGVRLVSGGTARYADFSGIEGRGRVTLGGDARWRAADGWWADLRASTDTGTLRVDGGRDGLFTLRFGYAEIPRHLSDSSVSPFLGVGTGTLTLPAGYPGATPATMPLATTLQTVDISSTRERLEFGASVPWSARWSSRVNLRRDVRDGLQRTTGAFFSNATQLPLALDQTTDQLEITTTYTADNWHATLGYQLSQFRNGLDALTWSNPFAPILAGATQGQLALAPDNQLQQIIGQAGYVVSSRLRASADFAFGRLTQDEPFLASTLNAGVAATLAPLSRNSLQGKVDTFNGNLRLSYTPWDALRLNASYSRDVRENRTPVMTVTAVTTDLFAAGTVTSTPYGYTQDRFKLTADYRGPGSLKLGGGLQQTYTNRTYAEASDTQETTAWLQGSFRPLATLGLTAKYTHATRTNDGYGVATWLAAPENPLMRKFNLADRDRDSLRVRGDWSVTETVQLGVHGEYANDDYRNSAIGLTGARNQSVGADLSMALSEQLSLTAWAQTERIRSSQRGSQSFAAADWLARSIDRVTVGGLGLRYTADKLTLGADISGSRSRNSTTVDVAGLGSAFPRAWNTLESLRLTGSYQLQKSLSLLGSAGYEHYGAADWHTDGLLPASLTNLLSLGEGTPQYRVYWLRAGVRFSF